MSAFVVNPLHVRVMVSWAGLHDVTYYFRREWFKVAGDEDRIAATLHAENVRSVNHRYRLAEPLDGFQFKFETKRAQNIGSIAVAKLCHCIAYQSCEHEGWESSEAKAIVDAIERKAVRLVPGYDAAPWELRP